MPVRADAYPLGQAEMPDDHVQALNRGFAKSSPIVSSAKEGALVIRQTLRQFLLKRGPRAA